jgi:hypothetical protein
MAILAPTVVVVAVTAFGIWQSMPTSPDRITVVLSEDAIVHSSAVGSTTVPWTNLYYARETPWTFMLWKGPIGLALPKRAFASADDLSRCSELVKRHLQYSRWFHV